MAITKVSSSLIDANLTITGGTVDDTVIGSGTPAAGTFTTIGGTLASSVTGTTQSAGDNSTKIATTGYVETALANMVDSAPSTLDTLNELAAALGDDPNFATTVTNSIALKAPLANPTFTGSFTSPGIDDNADAIAITIDSSEKVKIGSAAGSEKLSVQGSITSDGYIYPTTDNGWSLGLSTNRWGSVFAQTADFENSVGIGTSSPEYLLTLEDTTPTIALNHDTSWPAANAELGRIYFATDWNGVGAKIKGESDAQWGNTDYPGRLTFWTTPDGAADAVERLRISSGGDLILAGNATGAALIKGVSGDQTDRNTGGYPQFTFVGNEGTGIRRASANVLAFDTGGAEAARIESSGSVAVGHSSAGGAKFAISDSGNATIQFFPEFSTDNNLTQHYDLTAAAYMSSETRASSFTWRLGTNRAMAIDSSGTVMDYIANSGGNADLRYHTGTSVVSYDTSSERFKTNIRDNTTYGLAAVNALQSRMFEYKDDGRTDVGLIAEEVAEVVPELVGLDDENNPLTVDYKRFVSVLVKAMQEQQEQIEALTTRIAALEGE